GWPSREATMAPTSAGGAPGGWMGTAKLAREPSAIGLGHGPLRRGDGAEGHEGPEEEGVPLRYAGGPGGEPAEGEERERAGDRGARVHLPARHGADALVEAPERRAHAHAGGRGRRLVVPVDLHARQPPGADDGAEQAEDLRLVGIVEDQHAAGDLR